MQIVTFASGSTGNCTLVSEEGCHVLIDAGISTKRIKENLALSGLAPDKLSGILITHEHSDHISGLKTMMKYYDIPIFAPRKVAAYLRYTIAGVENSLHVIDEEPFLIRNMRVRAFHTPHDTEESVGYRLEGSRTFALATDMGCVTDGIMCGLAGADAVLIEANHDPDMLMGGPYPYPIKKRILSDHGHLSNFDCAQLAAVLADSGTKYIILGHISRENNTPSCAMRTVKARLEGKDITICAAPAAERLTIDLERTAQCSL